MRNSNIIAQIILTVILLVVTALIILGIKDYERLVEERNLLQEKVIQLEVK